MLKARTLIVKTEKRKEKSVKISNLERQTRNKE
jgi:hypothetical protein